MANPPIIADDNRWQTLRLVNSIRVILAFGLGLLALLSGVTDNSLGDPVVLGFLAVGFCAHAIYSTQKSKQRQPVSNASVTAQIGVDLGLLTGFVLATPQGLAYASLLFIPSMAGSLLIRGAGAYFYAALASLVLLVIQIDHVLGGSSHDNFAQTGALGLVFFSVAAVGHLVARRLSDSQTQLTQSDINLANLEAASSIALQNLDSGVVALDAQDHVQLSNHAAQQLLGNTHAQQGQPLNLAFPSLHLWLQRWRLAPDSTGNQLQTNGNSLILRVVPVGQAGRSGRLVFIEDRNQLSNEAQQSKLAALGQLTASIAHEIRNPLTAISHSAQLLGESPSLDEADQHLSSIIGEQVKRLDGIISNVLKLSRRDDTQIVAIVLQQWLQQFCDCFLLEHQLQPADIQQQCDSRITVYMDEGHLDQVLSNLCRNALYYSQNNGAKRPLVSLKAGWSAENQRHYLDIIDTGPGIDRNAEKELFAPFFTTRHDGTGLGLYLARSLCEKNGARLQLRHSDHHGCQFRISFAPTPPVHHKP